MSNIFDGQNDKKEADKCGCINVDGGGFCRGTGVAVGSVAAALAVFQL